MPRVHSDALRQFGQALLQSLGGPAEEAALVARLLVDANLSGHDSHGIVQIPGYLEAHAEGLIVPGARLTVERETATTALLDGHWGFGHKLAYDAMQLAIEKAHAGGLSAVGAYHCYHVGHLGAYARQAAEAGMVGLIAVNDGGGGQRVVPFDGLAGRLSTNPLAVGVPLGGSDPLLLDISTSVVAEGQVRLKHRRGEPLPLGWMIDCLGRATTNPEDFFAHTGNLLPLGGIVGYKGYGLALAVEVLAGILGHGGYSRLPMPPYNNGLFMIAIDVSRLLPLDIFTDAVQRLLRYIKTSPPDDALGGILYPGERAGQMRRDRLQHGIEIEPETWRRLQRIAAAHGIQVPDGV